MSLTLTHPALSESVVRRGLCALTGAIVVADALDVGAPGLALLAVPFVIAAIALHRESTLPMAGLVVWATLFVLIGVNFVIANGFDAGWGDLLFAYAGTPSALAVAVLSARSLVHHRRITPAAGTS